jgi:hypothetical protein
MAKTVMFLLKMVRQLHVKLRPPLQTLDIRYRPETRHKAIYCDRPVPNHEGPPFPDRHGPPRKERRQMTSEQAQEERERVWRENGCVKDSKGNWTVPYDLILRSLPRGEDR